MKADGAPPRIVAVANGEYASHTPLERAVTDTSHLVRLLGEDEGGAPVVLADLRRGALLDEIDAVLAPRTMAGSRLIVLWTGHGVIGPDGRLRLLARSSETADGEVATAGDLGEWAARTGAAQILVVVDTCFSGSGVPDALTMADAVLRGRADVSGTWFCVLAAARGDEPARSGALPRELGRLLEEGPRDPVMRLRWNAYEEMLRGDDLVDALLDEWSEPRHTPHRASTGRARPLLKNPLHRRRAPHEVVEHLLQAARGTSTQGLYFTGRERSIAEMVDWMRDRVPGVLLVTGPAGSGKSALLGRIVSLSVPDERARILATEVPAELDPGEGSVAAHLHVRGMEPRAVVLELAAQLDLAPDAGVWDLLACAERRRAQGRPMTVVVDGLDEAGETESRSIATEVLEPLAREALVVVGSRQLAAAVGEPGLSALLGAPARTVDLGSDVVGTLEDLRCYVVRRLEGVDERMVPEVIADEIVRIARAADPSQEGPFLLARLLTSQLRARPLDVSQLGWKSAMAADVETALESDLAGTVLRVDGRPHPTAARELLRALACAYGNGLPPDDVWPQLATATSASGTTYSREDVFALLVALGRHVVMGSEGGHAVYRIAHQRLVDHLRPTVGTGFGRRLAPGVALPVAQAVAALYEGLLDEGEQPDAHTYLWRHVWRHIADAGPAGVPMMRRLADGRPELTLDMAMVAAAVADRLRWDGNSQEALRLHEEAVELRRELDDDLSLATALFDLAFSRMSVGDPAGAEDAAAEASDLARAHGSDTEASGVTGVALLARALAQARQGNWAAARRIAQDSVELLERAAADDPGLVAPVASARIIAANAALNLGDVADADELCRRALESLDDEVEDASGQEEELLEAITTQARVFLAAPSLAADGALAALAARLVEAHRRCGRTGSVRDVVTAEGLRVLAITLLSRRTAVQPDDVEPERLLDEAIELLGDLRNEDSEAQLVLAMSHLTRGVFFPGAPTSEEDRDLAGHLLRHLAPVSAGAAAALGQELLRQVGQEQQRGELGAASGVERLREAVELMSRSGSTLMLPPLANALQLLAVLLSQLRRWGEVEIAAEEVLEVQRQLCDGSAARVRAVATALSDVVFRRLLTRPLEAIDLAAESLALLESVDDGTPTAALLRGIASLNHSAALTVAGRRAEAATAAREAVDLLDVEDAPPLYVTALGTALLNDCYHRLEDGDVEGAVATGRRAVDILAGPEALPSSAKLAQARVNLGRALRASGPDAQAEAQASIQLGIEQLLSELSDDVPSHVVLAEALNVEGSGGWDRVLAQLESAPETADRLRLLRARPIAELGTTVQDFLSALTERRHNPEATREVHEIARLRRDEDPAAFDAAWSDAAGDVPAWLSIRPSQSHQLVAWFNTTTWAASREFLLTHPELLDASTDVLLEELLLGDDAHDALIDMHLDLRVRAAQDGVDAAYAPVLAGVLVDHWLDAEDQEAYLGEHRDELLQPAVEEVLRRRQDDGDSVADGFLAVLTLVRGDEDHLAFQVLESAAFGRNLLRPAWRAQDVPRLRALAELCLQAEDADDSDRRLATVACAVAGALGGEVDPAADAAASAVADAGSAGEVEELRGVVTDAIAFHPDQAAALVQILVRLPVAAVSTQGRTVMLDEAVQADTVSKGTDRTVADPYPPRDVGPSADSRTRWPG